MTGIGGLVFTPTPERMLLWQRLRAYYRRLTFLRRGRPRRFLLLCFRRTGSNWLCGLLFNHPEIMMHNELFNENAVHSYYKRQIIDHKWDYEGRDCNPAGFVRFIFDDLYRKVGKFRGTRCKAIGFKSFPNHYLQHAVPHATISHEYEKLMQDPTVKKLVLVRENVPKVYVSSRRSHEQGNYMTRAYESPIGIEVADMQRFADRYEAAYEDYKKQLRGQWSYQVSYEELCKDPEALRPVLQYLGVSSDVLPCALEETVVQSKGQLSDSITNYAEVEFAFRHTHLSNFLPRARCQLPTSTAGGSRKGAVASSQRWVLLVPVHSGGKTSAECETLIVGLRDSLFRTMDASNKPVIIFGVDADDEIYCEDDHLLLRGLFASFQIDIRVLPAGKYRGQICRIWSRLADHAYRQQSADFTCLLGDDVVLDTPGWQATFERIFADVSRQRSLPYGAACVAFEDLAFRGFPTFPVIHRWHHETFNGEILPYQLVNQGGDPYLFELYKRFGASRFAIGCLLKNTIGGQEDDTRYTKERVRYEADILTDAIGVVQRAVCVKPLVCLDVVVPTFRCDVDRLRLITQGLRTSWDAAVSFWIILDNPEHPRAHEVRAMQSIAQNYQVNVRALDKNCGASAARNYGIGHSKADWIILIDDDVSPEAQLLDAYLGAAMRHPQAMVFVGSTHLPLPKNLLTHAIVASDIPGAYTIAERVAEPPWGVTANLCVRGRTSRLRFDLRYPKSGGGEDLDYCAQAARHGRIVAVPAAKADHPWWNDGKVGAIFHILGWADGEVLCVGARHLRAHVYFTLPNGIECASLALAAVLLIGSLIGTWWQAVTALFIPAAVIMLDVAWHAWGIGAHRFREPISVTTWTRTVVRIMAALLIMAQEFKRFTVALRTSPRWLCWRVDWHFGKSTNFVPYMQRTHAFRAMVYAALFVAGMHVIYTIDVAPRFPLLSPRPPCLPAPRAPPSTLRIPPWRRVPSPLPSTTTCTPWLHRWLPSASVSCSL